MKYVVLISLFLLACSAAMAQAVNQATQIEQVQTAVINLASKGGTAEFLRSDFAVLKGSVAAVYEDSFGLSIKLSNRKKGVVTVFYKEVLVISGKNLALSFIPDPKLRGFGRWDDVLKIDYNHDLEVVLDKGENVSGRLNEKTREKIVLIGESLDKKFSLPLDRIVSVYRVWREYDGAREGAGSGARKGENIGGEIGITSEGRALSKAFGAGIGAIIGTIVGAGRKESSLRVLIYSK